MPDPAADQMNEYQRALDQRNAMADAKRAQDAQMAQADAPLTTAGADQPQLFPASAIDVHPVVAAIVPAIHATHEPHNWAMTAAVVMQALAPLQDQIFTASRASAKTQAKINLAEVGVVTLAGILQMFFPHPRAG